MTDPGKPYRCEVFAAVHAAAGDASGSKWVGLPFPPRAGDLLRFVEGQTADTVEQVVYDVTDDTFRVELEGVDWLGGHPDDRRRAADVFVELYGGGWDVTGYDAGGAARPDERRN